MGAEAPRLRPVDVVVPVYRGLDETRRCLESVLATVRPPDGIVVIDDCSPEPEVTQWLRALAAREPRLRLLRNEVNLGFVGTVNRAMALEPERDVLLLNSDTEVSGDWLARMQRAAYGDPRIATVTPFSNNATICSWPRFCADNALPPGIGREELHTAFAAANDGAIIDVPTGVGFAMYIRRDALDALGLFDAEAFGKGYGEENDFCRRAAKAGWRNVLLADTFVYHAGAVSFGVDAARLDTATKALLKLHPEYLQEVRRFVEADPALPWRWRAALSVMRHGHLPVVLFVVHRRGGGTLVHVEDLARRLEGRTWPLILAQGDWNAVDLTLPAGLGGTVLPFDPADEWDELVAILRHVGVDRMHIHHLLDIPERVLDLPQTLGVPFDFTAHDFYAGCPRVALGGTDEQFCGQPDVAGCNACLAAPPRAPVGDVAAWRRATATRLGRAERRFAPHHDAARRLQAMVPELTFRPVPHPDAAGLAAAPPPRLILPPPGERLRVVVLGALSRLKGADLIEATALEAARRDLPVEFHHLGYAYRTLNRAGGRLIQHGRYRQDEVEKRLAAIAPHVAWLPACVPETYSYTLSEVIHMGLPVVVSDLGAPPDRVAGRSASWVLPWSVTPAEAADFLVSLRESPPPPEPRRPLPPLPDTFYDEAYLAETGLPGARPPRSAEAPPPAVLRGLALARARAARREALQGVAALRQRLWRIMVVTLSHPAFGRLVRHIPLATREWVKRLIKG
ncbi:glycosyltransferase [Caenispirillum bisanense]|uniref:Glycosyltransferase, GT2 family n=1 Tax=Caenispirillum bisanense TaxID=414052 RepID=A0A286GUJ8_9PROT|nr:glycosyltransferase [Caenispirillum bisanense]SOD98789.1 Glycosyltransferase, GT2 family [Caenispirillum bisanense]